MLRYGSVELNAVAGIAVRGIHLAASILVVGALAAPLIVGPSARQTALGWEARVLRRARWLLLVAVVAGLGTLGYQTALVEGRAAAALEPAALARFLLETRGGHIWLARHGVLLLLGAFLALRGDTSRRVDWLATRGEAVLLGLVALGLLGASGHAAAVEPATAWAIAVDAFHLVAAGVWAGALLPVAGLMASASEERGADARPHAVLGVRRFSRLALVAVLGLLASGIWNTLTHVGNVAGLVGTTYGRLLLVKLGLVPAILVLAAVNRRRLLPRLGGEATTVGRPALRRLARTMTIEATLALVLVGVVAALGTTPPARHVDAAWPFSFRLTLAALEGAPDLQLRALIGSQLAVLGLSALVAAFLLRTTRHAALVAALSLGGAGLMLMWPALAVDAYPTTYRRPTVTYHAGSIVAGAGLYREHCAACHGATGAGDGLGGRGLPRRPADLRAPHTMQHTAGDLFWWISHGIPRGGMPGFGERLADDQRWDVVNYLRALGATAAARTLGPQVEPGRPWLVAPDFTFAVGPIPPQSLRDYRGRRSVLLVLYSLPGSRPRLTQLAQSHQILGFLGVEPIAVPQDAAPDAIRRLASTPPVLFPIVTDGARVITDAYGLFAEAPHAEFLIDRSGYLRARWAPDRADGPPVRDMNLLLADIQELNEEPAGVPAADEHVH
jgi:putative copper export protein/mono/diheme cytochrome c family protein/peroxiredoxin